MATRKIATGTLVSVKADALQSCRRKPSERGVGIVQGRKKRRTVPINGVEDDEEDTTSILTSTTTGTGTTVFDIRYTLDNRLSQDVAKERVSVALALLCWILQQDAVLVLICNRPCFPLLVLLVPQPFSLVFLPRNMQDKNSNPISSSPKNIHILGCIDCNGGDDFVRERGGLHHNVRNCCVTVCDEDGNPKGMEMTTCYDNEENNDGGSAQQQYKVPDVGESIKQNLA
ncbi:hypothetical protein ACA910_017509 [Epithemia clementina (nom. ined.)]